MKEKMTHILPPRLLPLLPPLCLPRVMFEGLGFKVEGLGFRIWGSGSGVLGLGFRV